ncbi:hypothetical protein F5884DRAFT_774299 [Xylogone sp. PMI_703]|nr:hypothetical protein F5884DRAFT_774299 [Xylogone sp. PMI_703]
MVGLNAVAVPFLRICVCNLQTSVAGSLHVIGRRGHAVPVGLSGLMSASWRSFQNNITHGNTVGNCITYPSIPILRLSTSATYPPPSQKRARMSSPASPPVEPKTTHIERTSKEPRENVLHTVVLSYIEQVNRSVRLFRLSIPEGQPPIRFKPGQWLDVHIPGIQKPGGFTICSAPSLANPPSTASNSALNIKKDDRYLELAIKASPDNPAAAFLFRPVSEIQNTELKVRVGGSFIWPPRKYSHDEENFNSDVKRRRRPRRVLFVASGMGINPLISMLGHIAESETSASLTSSSESNPKMEITFLYGTRQEPGPDQTESQIQNQSHDTTQSSEILFLPRLQSLTAHLNTSQSNISASLHLYLTPPSFTSTATQTTSARTTLPPPKLNAPNLTLHTRRITPQDILSFLGPIEERKDTACYICGVPAMTDEFVEMLRRGEVGLDEKNVLFERWW